MLFCAPERYCHISGTGQRIGSIDSVFRWSATHAIHVQGPCDESEHLFRGCLPTVGIIYPRHKRQPITLSTLHHFRQRLADFNKHDAHIFRTSSLWDFPVNESRHIMMGVKFASFKMARFAVLHFLLLLSAGLTRASPPAQTTISQEVDTPHVSLERAPRSNICLGVI